MAKASVADIRAAMLETLPSDGSTTGNKRLREQVAARLGSDVEEGDYLSARDSLVQQGAIALGKGRGGSVRRVLDSGPPFSLEVQHVAEGPLAAGSILSTMAPAPTRQTGGPNRQRQAADGPAQVISYRHDQTRRNNPDVGFVTPETDPEHPKTSWAYDPHIDPALQFDVGRARFEKLIDDALASGDEATMRAALEQLRRESAPYLNWTGKAERTSFEIDTVSLHVHERIDPASILAVMRKRLQKEKGEHGGTGDLFRAWFEEPLPYREAIEFYKHERGWSNRLVAGDSLLVMNSLLHKEGMAGQVQMIYIDPPYGIKYGSNFQPFVNKRDVRDRRDEDLTQEPEMIKAFRDTWELGIHSYLGYLRDRLLLAKELLHEAGSVFVQISDENLHRIREVLDEVFGAPNFVALITFKKTSGAGSFAGGTNVLASTVDYLVWYANDISRVKYHPLYKDKEVGGSGAGAYTWLQGPNLERRRSPESARATTPPGWRVFRADNLTSQTTRVGQTTVFGVPLKGSTFRPNKGGWKTNAEGMERLLKSDRLIALGNTLSYVRFIDDFSAFALNNFWDDTTTAGFADEKFYVVQTNAKVVERCLLMTTDPGDLILDPTCGSGTTAFVAEKWGRRWITCDTSRVAVTLAKQRLMTASYDYYELKYPNEGLRGGFIYRTVPHVTLKSIANNPEIDEIHERMHPPIEQALRDLNDLLKDAAQDFPIPLFTVSEGGRKGQEIDFQAGNELLEWEVPFDLPDEWLPEDIRRWQETADPGQERALTGVESAFNAFHAARQAMQRKMDESIASHADQETLYDQPAVSRDKLRITGPFTVEAVPFPSVLSLEEGSQAQEADASVARSGESLRQHSWRDELLKTGIRGKGGQMIRFADLEALPDTRHLHCTGHTDGGERVVVSFGPEHAALEQRQVELAMREAGDLFPRPKMIVFCAFTFDPEAAKDIDATRGITALKAQMNTDLLTEDLKKARSGNQSFWLMGQPDVELRQRKDGRYEVEVNGFDYFDTSSGELKSGGKRNIAAWSLDTDYDERSLFPRQVFFPMAGAKDGWNKLRKDIKAVLDEARLDKLHGTVSLPFEPGDNRKVAVKIVDDRGIESLKVIPLP